jgi:hypothetical protein
MRRPLHRLDPADDKPAGIGQVIEPPPQRLLQFLVK